MSQLYSRSELLIKQAADKSKSGVVGNRGIKIPIVARINKNMPSNRSIHFLIIGGLVKIHQHDATKLVYFILKERFYRIIFPTRSASGIFHPV